MKKYLSLLVAFAALTLSACTSQIGSDAKLPETLKIGVVAPLSGDAAAYGVELQRILSYQVANLNKTLESKGTKVELIYEDGKCTGAEAASAFQKLTDIDGVKFVIGGVCSSETLAMDPLASEKKVLLVSSASSNPDLEKAGDYTFSFSYSDDLMGKTIAAELNKFSKIAIISEQNDFNIGIKKTVEAALDPKVEVVANEVFPKGTAEFRNILAEIKAAGPDALLLNPNVGATGENLIKQLVELDGFNAKLITHYSYLAETSRTAVGNKVDGMLIIDAPKLSSPALDKAIAEITASKGTLDTLGAFYTAATIDDFNTVTALILENGYDPEAVRAKLSSGKWEGMLGTLTFKGNNFVQGIGAGKYIVKDGKAVFQK
jgi:branched-chain amino acid transport system substrate-binding protein